MPTDFKALIRYHRSQAFRSALIGDWRNVRERRSRIRKLRFIRALGEARARIIAGS